jgi:undecaprenyl-diphosphatase
VSSRQDLPLVSRRGGWWGAFWATVVVVALGILIVRDWAPLVDVDRSVLASVRRWALQNDWAVQTSLFLSEMGTFRVSTWVAIAGVLLLLAKRRYWQALTLGLLAALAPLVANLIKPLVARERPIWDVYLANEDTFAYPSGHATGGVAVWIAVGVALGSLLHNRVAGAFVVFTFSLVGIAIGLSRIVLGVHYPSDVVGGWCIAIAFAGLLGALFVLPPYEETEVRAAKLRH